MDSTTTIIESQCDWLTLVRADPNPQGTFVMWSRAVLAREEREGGHRGTWGAHGYQGEICGRARYGIRQDGAMLALSGDCANNHLGTAVEMATNITRLDLAVTIRLDGDGGGLEQTHYSQFLRWRKKHASNMQGRIVLSADGGATLYIGSRASELMLRIYDKERESVDPWTEQPDPKYVRCHRYELEIKGHRALLMTRALVANATPPEFVRATLYMYCLEHGIDPAFHSGTGFSIIPGFRRRSDLDSKLAWIRNQVRPTLDWLREHGQAEDVIAALGYDTPEAAQFLRRYLYGTSEQTVQ